MKNKQIKIGAIISYASIVVNLLAGLFFTPWMIEMIGKSQFGLYTLANSLITLFLIDFGLSAATARYISRYHAEGDEEGVNNFAGVIYKFYGIIDCVIFVVLTVLYFCLPYIYNGLTPAEMEQFKVVYIIAAAFNIVNLPFLTLNGILTAYEKFIQLKAADLIYRVLLVTLTIIALKNGLGLYALVSVTAISGLAVILYKYIAVKATTKVKANLAYKDKKLFKEIVGFSAWVTVSTLAQRLIFTITPSILGIVTNAGVIGVFGVVTTIEGYFYIFTTVVSGMFMPKITRACIEEEHSVAEKLLPLMINVGRFQFALNGLLFLGFALLGKHFIMLWMGAEYIDAYLGILLVTAPGLLYNSMEVANTLLVVKNKVRAQAIVAVICGLLNVVLSFILSAYFGLTGACLSIFAAYALRAVIYFIMHKKMMGFKMWEFTKKCFFRILPVLIITLAFGIALNYFVADAGWLRLMIKIVAVTAVYVVACLLFGFTKNERSEMLGAIAKKFRREPKNKAESSEKAEEDGK